MKCVICKKTIRAKETRIYSFVGKRKVYSCKPCEEAFDAYLEKAELAELARVAKTWTDDPKQAAGLVDAYLAGQSGMMPVRS